MKDKNLAYYIKYPFINYLCFSFISLLIVLYSFFNVAKAYLTQNTKTIKVDNKETCKTNSLPFCNISDDNQFPRFILLALDGISFHYIQPLLDYFGKNVQLYMTVNDLNRFTLPIFRTWLTGRDNIRILPYSIEEDTIMNSYNRTYGIKLYVAGSTRLFRQTNLHPEHSLFAGIKHFRNTKKIHLYRPYKNWFDNKKFLYGVLNTIKENNYSMLAYDDLSDHVQHWEGYHSLCTNFALAEQIPKKLAEDIQPFKDFIDNNIDYVLAISSDHGHDEVFYENTSKTYKLPNLESFTPENHYSYYDHGGYLKNNTGWWLFYSPLLSPSHRLMNVTDVASTWMKYIENVDIPANNVGRPMNSMKYIRNEIKVKQQGLAQLWNLCRKSTKYCKGNVYEEGLEWKEGEVRKMDKERNEMKVGFLNRESKEIKERELELVKNIVSMNANEVFPYNLSVNEIRRISEGRDKEPRRKEKQKIVTHYYYEYDMDEEGNLYDDLKEKNEILNISTEEAKEITDKYALFINESEILHNLIYDTVTVIKRSDYYSMVDLSNSSKKRSYCKGFDINAIIISFLIIIIIIDEFSKRRKSIKTKIKSPPSLLNFFREFKSSYSIINSLRSCVANSSFLIVFILFISLFFLNRPLHLQLFLLLSLFLLFVLLPLINALINRISLFVTSKDRNLKNNEDKLEETDEEFSIYNNHINNTKKSIKKIIKYCLDLFEIYLCFIILHLVVEYSCFSVYGWLWAVGEDSFFNFAVDKFWIGINDTEDSYVLATFYMIVVKAGLSSVHFLCSAYMKEIGKNIKIILSLDNEEKNQLINSNILNNKEVYTIIKKDNFLSKFFSTHISLLFIPLPLSSLLQFFSMYLLSFVGTTVDFQKQNHYLIYALVQGISVISALIPLLL